MSELTEQQEMMLKESMRAWDSRADDYYEYAKGVMENLDKDSPSKFVLDNMNLDKNSKILDVGCGTGHYDIDLAKRVKSVNGIDFSANMIEYANKITKESNIDNVEFEILPWQKLNLEEKKWKKEFDLVFATTTPAISTLEDLQKMSDASKKYCFFTGLLKSEEKHRTYVKENIINTKPVIYKDETKEYFDYLWNNGYYPSIIYKKMEWTSNLNVEQSIDELIGYEGYEVISKNYKEIKEYYDKISVNGSVNSLTKVIVFWLYWRVDNQF